jgi:hypothetical protein
MQLSLDDAFAKEQVLTGVRVQGGPSPWVTVKKLEEVLLDEGKTEKWTIRRKRLYLMLYMYR